jgi:ArsR family transcriptional regulator, arsenate/arsenite/antimonite-responsive transcriptional repressor
MKVKQALSAFAALSQETRLDAFRLLVSMTPEGLPAGDLARDLDVPPSTLSSHLAILERAGLVRSERQGRTIFYRADLGGTRAMIEFLIKDCCHGQPQRCDQLIAAAIPVCCP